MKKAAFISLLGALLSGAGWMPCPQAVAQEVVAVLSSDAAPYQEALAGFKEGFGGPIDVMSLPKGNVHLGHSEKVIVAFGGQAALYPYPAKTTLIYCLAPGLVVGPDQHNGPSIKVRVDAKPEIMLANLKAIQPSMKRLAMFWMSSFFSDNFVDLQRVSRTFGIEMRGVRLESLDELPGKLRALSGNADALYFAPDPELITPGAFAEAKEFGRANNMPLYVPVEGLVDKGASASIAPSFKEMGLTAGRLAAQAAAGNPDDTEIVYPAKCHVTLNLTAAVQSGLQIPADVVKKADRVVP